MEPAPAFLSDYGKYKPQPSEESVMDILPSYSFIWLQLQLGNCSIKSETPEEPLCSQISPLNMGILGRKIGKPNTNEEMLHNKMYINLEALLW